MALAVAGCATPGTVESLETQLREQEDRIVALEADLVKSRSELEVARRESNALRLQTSPNAGGLVEEQSLVLSRVEKIRFHPLLTSGVDVDSRPGDDRLTVLLMPVDRDGELLRLPGKVELELFDMTLPGDRQRIGQWTFTPEQTRARWLRSLLSAGYQYQLDWQERPHSNELTLHGRLTTADGRQFDATSQVKVQVVGAASAGGSVQPASYQREASGTPSAKASGPSRKRDPQVRRVSRKVADPARPGEKLSVPAPAARRTIITSDRFTEPQIPTLR
jgi:hypothetical protein